MGLPINDGDSDDDGLLDGEEPNFWDDQDGDGLPNALDSDSDDDGVLDGTESGVTQVGEHTDTSQGAFVADVDPASRTWMLIADSDGDGFPDGEEDLNANGRLEGDETDPLDPLDPAVVRCDFDFQCLDALGEGHFCDTESRTCVEGEPAPECVTDEDCVQGFGEDFYCEPATESCQRRQEGENNENNGQENNGNNGEQPDPEPEPEPGTPQEDEGCGCSSVSGAAPSAPSALWLLGLVAFLWLRRRR
jgi:MYXO-CTERM domain-containing protein